MLDKVLAVAIPGALCAIAYAQTPKPVTAPTDWTATIGFEAHDLPTTGQDPQTIRRVHPDYTPIAGWISAVGAAVALFDRDEDGLFNDYCLVDTRFDTVTVAPVPQTGDRFAAFDLSVTLNGAAPESVAPMGCLPADLDGDGRQDLVLYYWGRGPSLHLASEGFAPRPLLDTHEIWHTNAAVVSDINGDGAFDLVFGNYFPDSFEVLGTAGTARMQRSMSRAANAGQNRLFLGDGAGGFRDASHALADAAPRGWTLALGAADLDGDQLPELYVGNDFGMDHVLHNRSADGEVAFARVTARRGLTDPRSRVMGRDSFKGMGVDFGDMNRDGILDVYVSNIAEDYALMESHLLFQGTGDTAAFARGRAPFKEVSGQIGVARSSWSWDARMQDFDGDGWSEIVQATGFLKGDTDRWAELHEVAMGNDELLQFPGNWAAFGAGADLSGDRHDAFFMRGPDGRWHEAGAAVGFDTATVTRGIAIGDVDGDGDPDMVMARQWAPSVVYLNTADPTRFATIVAKLALPNGITRAARGAQITLRTVDGTGPVMTEVVPGGEGHSGKSAPEVHFGLGSFAEGAPLEVEIRWRAAGRVITETFPIRAGRQVIDLQRRQAMALPVADLDARTPQ